MSKAVQQKQNQKPFEKLGFTESEYDALKAFFDSLDVHNIGKISIRELKNNMINTGYELKSDVIFEMINHLNRDGYTEVSFDQFVEFMSTKPKLEDETDEMLKIFELFDEEGTGVITQKQFSRVCRELGYDLSPEDVKEALSSSTNDESGQLTFKDFLTIMTKSSFP